MNGYTIGFIVEGVIAVLLLIAIILVVTVKRKTYSVSDYEESTEPVEKDGDEQLLLSYDSSAGSPERVSVPAPFSAKPPVLGTQPFHISESPIYRQAPLQPAYDNRIPVYRHMPRPNGPDQLELVSDEVVYEDGTMSRPPMARNIRQVSAVYVADEDRAAYDDVFRRGRPPMQQAPYAPPYQDYPVQQAPYAPPYQDYPVQQAPYMSPYQDYPVQQAPYMPPYQEQPVQPSPYARLYQEYPARFVPYEPRYQSRPAQTVAEPAVEEPATVPDVHSVPAEQTAPLHEGQVGAEGAVPVQEEQFVPADAPSPEDVRPVGFENEDTSEIKAKLDEILEKLDYGTIIDPQIARVEETEDKDAADHAGVEFTESKETEYEAADIIEETESEEPEEVETGVSSEISVKLDEILSKLNDEVDSDEVADSDISTKLDEILARLDGEDEPDGGEDTDEIRDKLDEILSRMEGDDVTEEVEENEDVAEIRSKLDEILTRLDEVEARSADSVGASGEYYGKSSHKDNYPYLFGEGRTTEEYEGARVGEDGAVVHFTPSDQSFTESFDGLSKEQKKFFTDILNYAMNKPSTEEKITKTAITVRSKGKHILRLKIRRKTTVASFKLENDLLREYRRNTSAPIKLKETEVYVVDEDSKQTACGLIDLMIEQYEQRRQEDIERRKAMRAARRAEQRAAAGEIAASSWIEEDAGYDSDEFDDEYDDFAATEYLADYDYDDDDEEEEFADAEEPESATLVPEEGEFAEAEPVAEEAELAEAELVAEKAELAEVEPVAEETEAAEVEPIESEQKAEKLENVESGFSKINARLDELLAKFHIGKQTKKEPASEEPENVAKPEEGKSEKKSNEVDGKDDAEDGFYSPFIDDDDE